MIPAYSGASAEPESLMAPMLLPLYSGAAAPILANRRVRPANRCYVRYSGTGTLQQLSVYAIVKQLIWRFCLIIAIRCGYGQTWFYHRNRETESCFKNIGNFQRDNSKTAFFIL
ncbi:hypothetical protein [Candidatus Tokpelaia sp.]|uniref:hypothetical protein n=1 Tax=Candidatus Tokpelaia sp. TaxID=2233777 RepID=UPI00123B7399|nr:hypothetical protein [Candidatus Tokpelaia sp.]KAA6404715.1 hypothetical protein DPQ22_07200 [Candidatus Tokpelaia sp.]